MPGAAAAIVLVAMAGGGCSSINGAPTGDGGAGLDASACSGPQCGDAAAPTRDTGVAGDAGAAGEDAGTAPVQDAGAAGEDTGTAPVQDAGAAARDAGTTPPQDAGAAAEDAGGPAGDAAALVGTGWTGSTSLADYPKTGPITTGCPIVDIDDGAGGKTVEQRFQDALALLSGNSCVLLRDDSGAPVTLTAHVHRDTAWSSSKRIFAYGTQRITLDGSQIPASTSENQQLVFFSGAANEHWKGFEVTGARNGNVAVEKSPHITLEDFWIHHNANGTGVAGYQADDLLVQDCVYWHNGTLGYQPATHSGDGFTSAVSARNVFVRCVAINAPDDGFDLYLGDYVTILDSVAVGSGWYYDGSSAGDGDGFKLGGDVGNTEGAGGATLRGCVAVHNKATGVSHWDAYGAARTVAHNTSYDNGYTNVALGGIAGDVIDSNLADTAPHADSVAAGTFNHWSAGADPLFAAPARGDLSLLAGSPCLGAGSSLSNQGASTQALRLLLDTWHLK
ncbi:MAG: right-handed parallel beta-helix repeat-containing protein [Myxococcales bacterium]